MEPKHRKLILPNTIALSSGPVLTSVKLAGTGALELSCRTIGAEQLQRERLRSKELQCVRRKLIESQPFSNPFPLISRNPTVLRAAARRSSGRAPLLGGSSGSGPAEFLTSRRWGPRRWKDKAFDVGAIKGAEMKSWIFSNVGSVMISDSNSRRNQTQRVTGKNPAHPFESIEL